MDGTPNIARIGALLGDNTRASMLSALLSRVKSLGWVKNDPDSHIIKFSAIGERAFETLFQADTIQLR